MTETITRPGPHRHDAVARLRGDRLDRLLGSDPGLNRLLGAVHAVVSIGLVLIVERVFVAVTGALQDSVGPGTPAAVIEANHARLVVALMLGAMICMVTTLSVIDADARGQLISMLVVPVPMIAALTLGLLLGEHRTVSLVCLALVMGAGTWLRRFGPRGLMCGFLLFLGDFLGFFLRGSVPVRDLGWLVAELLVGLATAIAVRFTVFRPRPRAALIRTQRSYAARARRLAALALETFDDPRKEPRLNRQLTRLNEAALMIDAQLGDPAATPHPAAAEVLHQRLFDLELALSNLARLATVLGTLPMTPMQRNQVRAVLVAVVADDLPTAREVAEALSRSLRPVLPTPDRDESVEALVAYRFADAVRLLAEAMADWLAAGSTAAAAGCFTPAAALFGGWLPGSAVVSATASEEPVRRGDGVALTVSVRAAIQATIAVGLSIIVGSMLSERRFYWAVIAAFVTFTGANTSAEQIRKALFRVAGTFFGIILGSLVVAVLGTNAYASVGAILASVFLGFYLMRISYAFLVVGITVMVSQLYLDLGEFSHSLLVLRLEETAVGAGIAILVVLLVVPLNTHRVVRLALRQYLEALGSLVAEAGRILVEGGGSERVRGVARRIDAAQQELIATARPVRRSVLGSLDEDTGRLLHHASAAGYFARSLVVDLSGVAAPLPDDGLIRPATQRLEESVQALTNALAGDSSRPYVRAAALLSRAENSRRTATGAFGAERLALRSLRLLDGAFAAVAQALGVSVEDPESAESTARPARLFL